MILENVYLSQKARDQLIKLKRVTGIQYWNILARWGFCFSLADRTIPPKINLPSDHAVEMTWKVFGGEYHEIYTALLEERCVKDCIELTKENLSEQFRLHVHRGIGQLSGILGKKSISDLFQVL